MSKFNRLGSKVFPVIILVSSLFLVACGNKVSNASLWGEMQYWFGAEISKDQISVDKMYNADLINSTLLQSITLNLEAQLVSITGLNDEALKLRQMIIAEKSNEAKNAAEALLGRLEDVIRAIPIDAANNLNPHGAFENGEKGIRIELDFKESDGAKSVLKNGGEQNRGLLNETKVGPSGAVWGLTETMVAEINNIIRGSEIYVLNSSLDIDLLRVYNTARIIFNASTPEEIQKVIDSNLYQNFTQWFERTGRSISVYPAAYITAPLLIDDPRVHLGAGEVNYAGQDDMPFSYIKNAYLGADGWQNIWEEGKDLEEYRVDKMSVEQLRSSTFADLPNHPDAATPITPGQDTKGLDFWPEFTEPDNAKYILKSKGPCCAEGSTPTGAVFTAMYEPYYTAQVPYRDLKIFGTQYVWAKRAIYDENGKCTHEVEDYLQEMPHLAAVVRMGRFNEHFIQVVANAAGTTGSVSLLKDLSDHKKLYVLTYPVHVVESLTTDPDKADFRVNFERSDLMIDLLNLTLNTMAMSADDMARGQYNEVNGKLEAKELAISNGHRPLSDYFLDIREGIDYARYNPLNRFRQVDKISGREGRDPVPVLDITSFVTVPPRNYEIAESAVIGGKSVLYGKDKLTWLAYPGPDEVPDFLPVEGAPNDLYSTSSAGGWFHQGNKDKIIVRNGELADSTYGPRIVLRDYLEMFYMPDVVLGEDFITVGRLIRINEWSGPDVASQSFATVLDGKHQPTNIRFAPHNFLDQRSTSEYIRLYYKELANGAGVGERHSVDTLSTGGTDPAIDSDTDPDIGPDADPDADPDAAPETDPDYVAPDEFELGAADPGTDVAGSMNLIQGFGNPTVDSWFDVVYPTVRFPGQLIARSDYINLRPHYVGVTAGSGDDSRKIVDQPVLYGMAVTIGPHRTDGMGWMSDTQDEYSSLAWFNRWLAENSFLYKINTHRLQAQFQTQFGLDIGLHAGLAGPDITTIELIQEDIDLKNQLGLVGFINAVFLVFGIFLLTWSVLIPIVWLVDVNMPFDLNLLGWVTFKQWTAVDNPGNLDLPKGYVGIGTTVKVAIVLGILGCIFLMLRPIAFFIWLIELIGGPLLDMF